MENDDVTIVVSRRLGPGTKLNGVYEIDASLAPGGMGEIYKGHQIFSGKAVAIKFIRQELENDPDARQMFVNEGKSLGEIHHDAVVRCYPLSVDPVVKRLYLPMDFVEGPSLQDLMKSGPIGAEQTRHLLRRVASGLQVAHDRHIFHRDISPDNIIVPEGDCARAVIIDFGIARLARTNDVTVIGDGFAGKYNYVSPEQCGLFGGDVRAQSDIYSLGLVVAGALLGRRIEMGGSYADVTAKRLKVPPLDGIDTTWRPVLTAMLQPDPKRRPASMQIILDQLAPTIIHPMPPAPRKRKAGVVLAASLVAATALVGGLAVSLGPTLRGMISPQPDSEPVPSEDKIRAFLAASAPDACLVATPVAISPSSADIDILTQAPVENTSLSQDFTKTFGFAPTIRRTFAVAPLQCAALGFVKRFASTKTPALTILTPGAPKRTLRSGRLFSGVVGADPGAAVSLLRIDENGTVQDLSDSLKPGAGEWGFQVRLDRAPGGSPQPQPQVVIAVVGARTTAWPRLPDQASLFFDALGHDLGPSKLDLAISGFDLEK